MTVVSDTTPLNYLILIEAVQVLPALFGRVYAPTAVIQELSDPRGPESVRTWAGSPPEWLTVQELAQVDETPPQTLHKGEVEAIFLAQELGADWILIDERKASRVAESRGLRVAGTLGIFEEGGVRNLLDYEKARNHLVNRHVCVLNAVSSVKGVKEHVIGRKTLAIRAERTRKLLALIDCGHVMGLRDRAIIATLAYTACRSGRSPSSASGISPEGQIGYVGAGMHLRSFFAAMWGNHEWKFRPPNTLQEEMCLVRLSMSVINALFEVSDYPAPYIGGEVQLIGIPLPARAIYHGVSVPDSASLTDDNA
jgi:predicted nucleic acid-binding protein